MIADVNHYLHNCATHLLEMGANLVLLKELLGRANIRTTMTYLHVCVITFGAAFTPLDKLFPPKEILISAQMRISAS